VQNAKPANPFERSFLNATFAMVGLGVLSACVSDPTAISVIMLACTIPLLCGSYYCTVVRGGPYLPARVASALASLLFLSALFFVMTWWSVLLPFLHFLSFVQCLRLWQKKTTREFTHLYLVSVVQVASGSSISLDLKFGLFFLLYLVIAFWTLVLFYLRRESQEGAGVYLGDAGVKDLTTMRAAEVRTAFGRGLPALFGVLFGGMVGLFLILPRYHLAVLNLRTPMSRKALVGFSETTKLGQIGEIKENTRPVMRVKLTKSAKPIKGDDLTLLWRGMSVDSYHEGEWRATSFRRSLTLLWRGHWIPPGPGVLDDDGLQPYLAQMCPELPNSKAPIGGEIRQEITLDPIGTKVIFSLYPAVHYLLPDSSGGYDLDLPHWNATFARSAARYYVVYSRPKVPSEDELDRATADWDEIPSVLRTYFVLNPAKDRRLTALAKKIVADASAGTPYQQVKAVRRWLELNCRYTRLPGVVADSEIRDPVLNFLLKTRKGHCEYFAAAQVLLTRALGIPARVVNGFRGGEWHELGQFYIVRQSHAHSWAEVYLKGVKWFPVDPSPSEATADALAESGAFERFVTYGQSLWDKFVIGYRPRQIGLSGGLFGQGLFDLQTTLGRPFRGPTMYRSTPSHDFVGKLALGLGLAVAGAVVISLVLWIGSWHWPELGWARLRAEELTPVQFYRDLLRLLRKRGFRRERSTTPREFAEEVVTRGGEQYTAAQRVTDLYYTARFSESDLTDTELQEATSLLKELRKGPRKS